MDHDGKSGEIGSDSAAYSRISCERCRSNKRKCDKKLPECSLCSKQNRECLYQQDLRSKKRKYWDEEYVRSLEDQVQTLLQALGKQTAAGLVGSNSEDSGPKSTTNVPQELSAKASDESLSKSAMTEHLRSRTAVDELSMMMWRTNLGDGVRITDDIAINPQRSSSPPSATNPGPFIYPPDNIIRLCEAPDKIYAIARLFFENINHDHQFTDYTNLDFLTGFPFQSNELNLLHSTILAVGATYSRNAEVRDAGEQLAAFAESLVMVCCRHNPTCVLVRALCMLSWRSLTLGIDQFAWIFISMAAGIAVHLRLHVLALEDVSARSSEATPDELRTFWMFYMTDRTAISILGRNCGLPWRRVNVPDVTASVQANEHDLAKVSFAWQCKLWYIHDRHMDQIFAPTFQDLPYGEKVRLLISTHRSLNSFHKAIDQRLALGTDIPAKAVLMFHMAYHMAFLITMPSFLQLSTASRAEEELDPEFMFMILRTLTHAAASMARIVRKYLALYDHSTANPVIIHHLLSAAIVHLMNATSSSANVRAQSSRSLRSCMDSLTLLKGTWTVRGEKSIRIIRVLAYRWKAVYALPIEHSNSVDLDQVDFATGHEHDMMKSAGVASNPASVMTSTLGTEAMIPTLDADIPPTFALDPHAFLPADHRMFTDMPVANASDIGFLMAFQSLNEADNFDWLFGDGQLTDMT